jgi:hypothetical protein
MARRNGRTGHNGNSFEDDLRWGSSCTVSDQVGRVLLVHGALWALAEQSDSWNWDSLDVSAIKLQVTTYK